ncbi:MAG: deoxyguanosinetriphosphate triphosphohydrolase [bacterium]
MLPREYIEQKEREYLSPYATLSSESRGRQREEKKCDIRTDFQRDRDRIIHSKAFRRLKHKTQVFIAPEGDHYRTRLTHTLEVSQIARTIGRALRLNEDLIEAISLAHDIGHTPFGHAGEEALDAIIKKYIPTACFRHNEQGLRVVDFLEKNGEGLNLTNEVREGILYHSKGMEDLDSALREKEKATLEAKVVMVADRIAYINHDIDDAIRAGLIKEADIPAYCLQVLGTSHSERIGKMVRDIVEKSENKPFLSFSQEVLQAIELMKDFLYETVYKHPLILEELEKAKRLLHQLFEFYMENPSLLPSFYLTGKEKVEDTARAVCDFIAGMTDHYAYRMFTTHLLPHRWEEGI